MFFDSNEVKDMSFEPLPEGWYDAVIVEQEYKQTSSGTGYMAVITFQTLEAQKKVKYFYNLVNKNETAQNIGKAQFKNLLRAVSIEKLQTQADMAMLVGRKLSLKLGIRKHEGNEYNEVKDVAALGSKIPIVDGVQTKKPEVGQIPF